MEILITADTVWSLNTANTFFLIPTGTKVPEGKQHVNTLFGESFLVNGDYIQQFEATEQEVFDFLKGNYAEQLENSKKAMLALNLFANKTGRNDQDFINQMLKGEWSDSQKAQPFSGGKEIVEGFIGHVNDTSKTYEEQQADFVKLFGKVPDIMKFFDEKTLAEAAKNPEKWANEMNEKLFGEEEALRRKKRSEQLKNEVRESIEKGLRNAGMEPEAWKDDASNSTD